MNELSRAPQSIGEVLDTGFKLFQASFKKTFWLATGASLLYAPLGLVGGWWMTQPTVSGAVLAGASVGCLSLIALASIFTATAIARIDGVATGRELSLIDALSSGTRRAPAQLIAVICYVLAVAGGMLLALLPGFILMATLIFGPVAAVVERLGPIASLRFSSRMVRGHWWRTTSVLTVIGIIVAVQYVILIIVVLVAVEASLEQLVRDGVPWYISFVLSPLLSGVATSLASALLLAALYDLKLRHDGADIAARIAAISA